MKKLCQDICVILITASYRSLLSNPRIRATFSFLFLVLAAHTSLLIPGAERCRSIMTVHCSLFLDLRCCFVQHIPIGPVSIRDLHLNPFSLRVVEEEQMEAHSVLAVFWYVMYRSSLHVIDT